MEFLKPILNKPALRKIGLNKPSLFAAGNPQADRETWRILDDEGNKLKDINGNLITYK